MINLIMCEMTVGIQFPIPGWELLLGVHLRMSNGSICEMAMRIGLPIPGQELLLRVGARKSHGIISNKTVGIGCPIPGRELLLGVDFWMSNGKYVTSTAHELLIISGTTHCTFPSCFTSTLLSLTITKPWSPFSALK